MSHDPDAIRRLTLSYRYLRGFEVIPIPLALLGTWLAELFLGRTLVVSLGVFVVLLAVALLALRAIRRYYDRRFGVVKTPGSFGARWAIIVVAFFVLQFVAALFALPVQLGFLVAGLALAAYALRNFRLEGQRLLLAAFFIVISVWPPITDPSAANDAWRTVFVLGFSTICTLMGLWDHRILVRTFESLRRDRVELR